MNGERLLIGVGGLIIGFAVGFMFANSVNRTASIDVAGNSPSNLSADSNSGLPPNHPPIGQSTGEQSGGALPQVTAAIEKAKREPQDFDAQMTAGDLYYQIQRFDDALEFYKKANRLRPEAIEPSIKIGNSHFDVEQYSEAEQWYSAVLKKTPNDLTVRNDLGLTFFLRTPRDVDRAIKEFEAALRIQPDNEMVLQNLALAFIEKGETDNLNVTLDKMARVNPDNPVLLKQRPK